MKCLPSIYTVRYALAAMQMYQALQPKKFDLVRGHLQFDSSEQPCAIFVIKHACCQDTS